MSTKHSFSDVGTKELELLLELICLSLCALDDDDDDDGLEEDRACPLPLLFMIRLELLLEAGAALEEELPSNPPELASGNDELGDGAERRDVADGVAVEAGLLGEPQVTVESRGDRIRRMRTERHPGGSRLRARSRFRDR